MIRQTLAVVFAALALSVGTNAGTISDGNFSNWSFSEYLAHGGISANATVFPSGGNPGAYLEIATSTGSPPGTAQAAISAIYLGYSTSAALSGAFALNLDVLAGPLDHGQGQAIDLIVDQGGALYTDSDFIASGVPTVWTTETFDGTFSASDFAIYSGSGPAQPDFSGGEQTYFGFFASNTTSQGVGQYYDNFSISNQSLIPSPEPSSLYLIIGGTLFCLFTRLRRNARQRCSQKG